MSFAVPGDVYDRYVGRYSRELAPRFIDFAGVDRGPVLDLGCGPGGLSLALASRLGPRAVSAVDPSESFVAACRARVPGADVRPGGTVAACMFASDGLAVSGTFWRAALRFDPMAPDDARLPFRREEELLSVVRSAGLRDVASGRIDMEAGYTDFDDFWDPIASGVGPTGDYLLRQPEERRALIRDECREILGRPPGAFTLPARVIAVRGRT